MKYKVDYMADNAFKPAESLLSLAKGENNMLIAVIGGKLQGVEAVYLAQKAGWQTLLIDKNPDAPAARLCDHFIEFEFSCQNPIPLYDLEIDLILPAIEDEKVLSALEIWARTDGIPLAFDADAYAISSSKIKSDTLFQKMNLPVPNPWPGCCFPVVLKPDQASGSQGVEIIDNPTALFSRFSTRQLMDNSIIQEFLEGPSYSIEVLGRPGKYQTFQVTDLGMDEDYDCKNVTAPTQLSENYISRFKKMAIAVAEEIGLNGIMDLEVILHQNELKLLEIDARLPSQTPMTVYWSTGINLVEVLASLTVNKSLNPSPKYERSVLVEHIKVCGLKIKSFGEHIMALDGPLVLKTDFFGADEAITSFEPGKHQWVSTMIFSGASQDEINIKRDACHKKIIEHTKNFIGETVK